MMEDIELRVLAPVTQLCHGVSYSFHFGGGDAPSEGFLINWHHQIYAYRNACPHTGVTLNWAPNQFMDVDERFLQCSLHGALFEPDTGLCIHGPCLGQSLRAIPIKIINGQICLDSHKHSE